MRPHHPIAPDARRRDGRYGKCRESVAGVCVGDSLSGGGGVGGGGVSGGADGDLLEWDDAAGAVHFVRGAGGGVADTADADVGFDVPADAGIDAGVAGRGVRVCVLVCRASAGVVAGRVDRGGGGDRGGVGDVRGDVAGDMVGEADIPVYTPLGIQWTIAGFAVVIVAMFFLHAAVADADVPADTGRVSVFGGGGGGFFGGVGGVAVGEGVIGN